MSSERIVHIISFDIPFPADYGGVIDVYYKIKALHDAGINTHLHCFEYGRPPREELNSICASVHYYPRQTQKALLFNTLPYIVLSRKSAELKSRLMEDKHPVLMEGLHTTFLLADPDLSDRVRVVRMHNIEHEYYGHLAQAERNVFKRYYFYNESGKLKKYENVLQQATSIAAISPAETKQLSERFASVNYIPVFHPFHQLEFDGKVGDFALYHGNLGVGENNEAALFLVNEVFNGLSEKLILAGSRPSADLLKAVKNLPNVELRTDLSPAQIHDLIRTAKCNVLPTFQSTGIKLKLLAALFLGGKCIVNVPMVEGTGLEPLCIVKNSASEMREAVIDAMKNFQLDSGEFKKREQILMNDFSNKSGVVKLAALLFPG